MPHAPGPAVVRKAVPAAALLGASAFLFLLASTLPALGAVGILGSVAGFAGFWFLLRDSIMADPRQRGFLIAAGLAGLVTILVGFSGAPPPPWLRTIVLVCTIAFVALPLWLLARLERFVHVVAAAFTVALGALWMYGAGTPSGDAVVSVDMAATLQPFCALGGAALGTWLLALRLMRPLAASGSTTRRANVAIAWNPPTLSEGERGRRLARLESQYRRGEIPEHEYLDRRQELES